MAISALIREQLQKAVRYLQDTQRAQCDEEIDPPEYDAKCEALLPLLRREIKAHFHVHRADDIFTAYSAGRGVFARLPIGARHRGHLIARELAQAGAGVICGPVIGARTKPSCATTAGRMRLSWGAMACRLPSAPTILRCQSIPCAQRRACLAGGIDKTEAIRSITVYRRSWSASTTTGGNPRARKGR
jgi:hypothetical protein